MFLALLSLRPTIALVYRVIEAATATDPNTLASSTPVSALVFFSIIEIPLN